MTTSAMPYSNTDKVPMTDFVRRLANEASDFEVRLFDEQNRQRFLQESLCVQQQILFNTARDACQFLSRNSDIGLYGDDPFMAHLAQACQDIERLQDLIAESRQREFLWQSRLNAARELLSYYLEEV